MNIFQLPDTQWHIQGNDGKTDCGQDLIQTVDHYRIGSIMDRPEPPKKELCEKCFSFIIKNP
jgi:hypothetical protein